MEAGTHAHRHTGTQESRNAGSSSCVHCSSVLSRHTAATSEALLPATSCLPACLFPYCLLPAGLLACWPAARGATDAKQHNAAQLQSRRNVACPRGPAAPLPAVRLGPLRGRAAAHGGSATGRQEASADGRSGAAMGVVGARDADSTRHGTASRTDSRALT